MRSLRRGKEENSVQAGLSRREVLKVLGGVGAAVALFPLGQKAEAFDISSDEKMTLPENQGTLYDKELPSGIRIKEIPLNGMIPDRITGQGDFVGNHNDMGFGSEFILAAEGVVGRYDYFDPEHVGNPSSVHLTGRNERTYTDLDVRPQAAALPANGYTEITMAYANLTVGNQVVDLPDQGPDHSYVVVVKGNTGDRQQNTDDSDTVEIRNYKPAHTGVKELGVALGDGSFKSEEDTLKSVVDAHGKSLTSKGDGGTSRVTLVLWSPQEKILVINESLLQSDNPKSLTVNDLNNWTTQFKNW
jgi:hypothetical protein